MSNRVDLPALRKMLTGKDKIPLSHYDVYLNVMVPGLTDRWNVVIRPGHSFINIVGCTGRPHRVFIECGCGREIPAGRWAQHRKACNAKSWADGLWAIRKRMGEFFDRTEYKWTKKLDSNCVFYNKQTAWNLAVQLQDVCEPVSVVLTWEGWKPL
jgi:hypothetical protein